MLSRILFLYSFAFILCATGMCEDRSLSLKPGDEKIAGFETKSDGATHLLTLTNASDAKFKDATINAQDDDDVQWMATKKEDTKREFKMMGAHFNTHLYLDIKVSFKSEGGGGGGANSDAKARVPTVVLSKTDDTAYGFDPRVGQAAPLESMVEHPQVCVEIGKTTKLKATFYGNLSDPKQQVFFKIQPTTLGSVSEHAGGNESQITITGGASPTTASNQAVSFSVKNETVSQDIGHLCVYVYNPKTVTMDFYRLDDNAGINKGETTGKVTVMKANGSSKYLKQMVVVPVIGRNDNAISSNYDDDDDGRLCYPDVDGGHEFGRLISLSPDRPAIFYVHDLKSPPDKTILAFNTGKYIVISDNVGSVQAVVAHEIGHFLKLHDLKTATDNIMHHSEVGGYLFTNYPEQTTRDTYDKQWNIVHP